MGLVGRRVAISAPTVGYASESTPVSTARPEPSLIRLSPGRSGTSAVRKSSKRASAISTAQTTHSDQANHAAVRGFIQLTPLPCSLAPYITTPFYSTTVCQALRQPLRVGVLARLEDYVCAWHALPTTSYPRWSPFLPMYSVPHVLHELPGGQLLVWQLHFQQLSFPTLGWP